MILMVVPSSQDLHPEAEPDAARRTEIGRIADPLLRITPLERCVG